MIARKTDLARAKKKVMKGDRRLINVSGEKWQLGRTKWKHKRWVINDENWSEGPG